MVLASTQTRDGTSRDTYLAQVAHAVDVPSPPSRLGFSLTTPEINMAKGAADHKAGGKATHRWEGDITGGGATQPHSNRVDKRELEADRLKEELKDAPTIK